MIRRGTVEVWLKDQDEPIAVIEDVYHAGVDVNKHLCVNQKTQEGGNKTYVLSEWYLYTFEVDSEDEPEEEPSLQEVLKYLSEGWGGSERDLI